MLEQEALNIRNENLTLIDAIEEEQYYKELEKEYVSMNVFYNSSYIDKTDKTLSFGDVFKCGNEYYICITALCDCVNPEKIKNSFFFAKGQKIKPTKVLKSAETGFVSFLDEQTAVQWNPNNNDNDKILSYIKPVCFTIPNNMLSDRKIQAFQLDKTGEKKEFEFHYITTIKQNYAQRIANHTFAYPVRVGVDFVKVTEQNESN